MDHLFETLLPALASLYGVKFVVSLTTVLVVGLIGSVGASYLYLGTYQMF